MKDFFENLPASRQHIIALAILFVIPLILFFDTTLGGKELQRHDITQWRAGAESIIEYREQFGEEPLWANNMFGGMPSFVISTKGQVPHLDVIANLFLKIYPAFQFWVLLSGMYFLLILMGFRPLTAVSGSMLFGLTTYLPVIIIAGHTSKLFALAFAPWIVAGYWIITRSEKKILGLLLFTVALALNVRAGHPQITYYFMFPLLFLWLFDGWNAIKQKTYKKHGIITILLLIGGIMGILGNAERTLSQQQYAQYSIRGGSDIQGTDGLDINYAFAWSQGLGETLTLLIPDVLGGANPDYWGAKTITSGPHYFGIFTFLFVIIALFKVRDKLMYVFLGTGLLSIFFAWGENFPLLNDLAFDLIPFFDKFRAPETWLILSSFSFAVIAAYGIEWLIKYSLEKKKAFSSFYKPLGTALGVFVLIFLYVNSLDFVKPGEVDRLSYQIAQSNNVSPDNPQVRQRASSIINSQLVPAREEKASKDVLRLGLFIVLGGGVIFMVSTSKVSASVGGLAIVLLIGIDMIPVDKRYMPDQNFVNNNVDPERYILSQKRDIDSYIQEHISDGTKYPYRVFPLMDNPFGNATTAYFYPIIGGYSGAKLSVAQDVFMAENAPLFSGPTGINLDLLRILNVKYITYQAGLNLTGLIPVFNGQTGAVYELQDVMPKAFFADSVITVQTPIEAYDYLYPGKVDFSTTAVVENYAPVTGPDTSSVVTVTDYTGPEMTIEISRSKPGFLVLSEIYYPDGWVATLDGEEIPIHKTNYLLRGFEIPAGDHTLSLDFRPDSFYTGIKLSWMSLIFQIGLALAAGFIFWKKRSAGEA